VSETGKQMSGKKRTPLYGWHVARGASMGDFGGYEMPLWYGAGPKEEHLAVITAAGIFDTSHMAAVALSGRGACALLQQAFSKDLSACIGPQKTPLVVGRCVYGLFLNHSGGVMDDALVYRNDAERYTVIVNAGMGGVIAEHLQGFGATEATVVNLTDRLGKIDVQGPLSARILSRVIRDPQAAFAKMAYFSFKGDFSGTSATAGDIRLLDGTSILLSRTGYTGEFGFEIFLEAGHTVSLWETLIAEGGEHGALPCGLAARDSLRTGAVLPLSHQDIGNWPFINNPWPFALPYDETGTTFTKSFHGSDALLNVPELSYTHPFVGFDPRKVTLGVDVVVRDRESRVIGTVLTSATDMAIDRHEGKVFSIASEDRPAGMRFRGLGCGFVRTNRRLETGELVTLQAGKREISVEIVEDIRPARTARRAMAKMLD